jgi:DsbC/DsbD-like thiol-disulfide interchange protein
LTIPAPNLFNGWVKRSIVNRTAAKQIVSILALIFAGFLPAGLSCASPAGRGLQDEQVVEVKTLLSRDGVRPGDIIKAAIILTVRPGYHINNNAPNDEFLFATILTFDDNPNLDVVETYYPAGHRGRFAYSQTELIIYEGEAVLGAVIKAKTGIAAGPLKLKATLSYQACDNTSCMPPKDLSFEIAVPVAAAGKPSRDLHPEVFSKLPFKTPSK